MKDKKRVVVLGAECVGKSAIVAQLISSSFSNDYVPTMVRCHNVTIDTTDPPLDLEITDTSGSAKHAHLIEQDMKYAHCFVLVYDITNKQSLNEVKEIAGKLQQVRGTKQVPMILVGSKLDLQDNRDVPLRDGEELAKQLGCPFLESSAKDRDKVVEIFTRVIRETDRQRAKEPEAKVEGEKKNKGLKCCVLV